MAFLDAAMVRIAVKGMTCGACVASIENYVANAVPGVISISVALLAEKAEVIFDRRFFNLNMSFLKDALTFKLTLKATYYNVTPASQTHAKYVKQLKSLDFRLKSCKR